MREVSVLFGNPKTLVGVVTDPDSAPNGLGLLFLNAGYTHRVGPQRVYTRLARELSKLGLVELATRIRRGSELAAVATGASALSPSADAPEPSPAQAAALERLFVFFKQSKL